MLDSSLKLKTKIQLENIKNQQSKFSIWLH